MQDVEMSDNGTEVDDDLIRAATEAPLPDDDDQNDFAY